MCVITITYLTITKCVIFWFDEVILTYHIVGNFSGDILLWDLSKSSNEKCQLLGKGKASGHSRVIFNICQYAERDIIVSISMDRLVGTHSLMIMIMVMMLVMMMIMAMAMVMIMVMMFMMMIIVMMLMMIMIMVMIMVMMFMIMVMVILII